MRIAGVDEEQNVRPDAGRKQEGTPAMKVTAAAILFAFLGAGSAWGDTVELGSVDIVRTSDIIAIVDIGTLTSTDETRQFSNLIAEATVEEALKGGATGEISFSIPIFFPCATFEVRTGRHLVFLRRHPNGGYFGSNYRNSYVPLGKDKIKWCGPEPGSVVEMTPPEIVAETKRLVEQVQADGVEESSRPGRVESVEERAGKMLGLLRPGMTQSDVGRLLGEMMGFTGKRTFAEEAGSALMGYHVILPGSSEIRMVPVYYQKTERGLVFREARMPEGTLSEDNAEAKDTQEVH